MAISSVIFLVVSCALFAAFSLLSRWQKPVNRAVHMRIREVANEKAPTIAARSLFKDLDVARLDATQEYALLGEKPKRSIRFTSWRTWLKQQLEEADLSLSPVVFLILTGALAVTLAVVGVIVQSWLGGLVGFLGGAMAPFLCLRFRTEARREKFVRQLPAAFELMARMLRAGQAVPQALQAVAESFEDPLASSFAKCHQQQNLGLSAEVVFREMSIRWGVLEFQLFVIALLIQRQTGGNLSEVLSRLAVLLQNRYRLRKQIRILTAEGRLQGWTLLVLPFVLFGALFVINRSYAQKLLNQGSLLAATGALMLVGLFWIQRIVNSEN